MPNNKIKILAMFGFVTLIATILTFAPNFSANAENDDLVKEIADYKNWKKLNDEPIKVGSFQINGKAGDEKVFIIDGKEVINFRSGGLNGWNSIPLNLVRETSKTKDLVHYISKLGKGVKGLFNSPPKVESSPKVEKEEEIVATNDLESLPRENHAFSFGEVYANDLAKAEIEKDKPDFPIGSIIVREKNQTATSETPQTVIAMVKRKKGFSEKTDDWEFFVFDGKDLQMQKRETVGNCAECHSNAKENDWVFREYLKK